VFSFSTWGDYRFFQDGFERMRKVVPKYANVQFKNQQATSPPVLSQRLLAGRMAQSWNTMPDVAELLWPDIARLADAGLLVDLTDRFKPFEKDVAPAVVEGVTYNGRIMACPWRPNTMMVWYREDVWSQAGVKADDIKLWSDFIEAGKKVTQHTYADGKKRYMMNRDASPTFSIELLTQQGGTLFDRKTGKLLAFENDPKFRTAFETQVSMLTSGIATQIDSFTPPWYEALKAGTVSCIIQGNWMDQILKQHTPEASGNWRVMEFPAFEAGGPRHALAGVAVVGAINKPDLDQDLAWEFMQHSFYDTNITPSLYTRWFLEPCYLPAQNSPENKYHTSQPFYGGQNPGELDQKIQKDAFTPSSSKNFDLVMSYINAEFAKAVAGKESVDAAIKAAATKAHANAK
jgi:lactose/L-arabinose transport system substrate-binding protein